MKKMKPGAIFAYYAVNLEVRCRIEKQTMSHIDSILTSDASYQDFSSFRGLVICHGSIEVFRLERSGPIERCY